MKSLNLDYLKTFVAVVEFGSFSAAADRLLLTQPAVSLQIRQLEKSLGTVLIERVGRVARPTTAGEELLTHTAGIDAAVSSAIAAVSRHKMEGMGRIRIGTGATACIFLLPPILANFRRKFPNIDMTVTTGNSAEIVKAVEDNMLDVGLVTLPVSGRSLDITPVMDDELVLLAPADMPLPARITAAVLSTRPVILFDPGGNTRRVADEWFAKSGVLPKPVMSLGSVEAIKAMVGVGLGCAILPELAVRRMPPASRTVVRSLSPRLHRTLATVVRRDKRLYGGLAQILQSFRNLSQAQ
ncbi:LysR family transcriptional regulator [Trinickia dinghuensis]|uniref:LysR family transcriptional regulator n=1 Tax=Trinickia dinghuensis TaxID=2291023 RepID=A0A3D8JY91_9BURK|nr:LysR family transcriptional regulator [Trinickia dinghuensis]RDU97969.1 LysR family transcriptional regulator [Trinickia dinghuensis]